MIPEEGLTENGKDIFKELVKHVKKAGLEDVDKFGLTELAQSFDLLERSRQNINFPKAKDQQDGVQVTANGYTQVTGYVTVRDKCLAQIEKLGAKYGLTPKDRAGIEAFSKSDTKTPASKKLDQFKIWTNSPKEIKA